MKRENKDGQCKRKAGKGIGSRFTGSFLIQKNVTISQAHGNQDLLVVCKPISPGFTVVTVNLEIRCKAVEDTFARY